MVLGGLGIRFGVGQGFVDSLHAFTNKSIVYGDSSGGLLAVNGHDITGITYLELLGDIGMNALDQIKSSVRDLIGVILQELLAASQCQCEESIPQGQ